MTKINIIIMNTKNNLYLSLPKENINECSYYYYQINQNLSHRFQELFFNCLYLSLHPHLEGGEKVS